MAVSLTSGRVITIFIFSDDASAQDLVGRPAPARAVFPLIRSRGSACGCDFVTVVLACEYNQFCVLSSWLCSTSKKKNLGPHTIQPRIQSRLSSEKKNPQLSEERQSNGGKQYISVNHLINDQPSSAPESSLIDLRRNFQFHPPALYVARRTHTRSCLPISQGRTPSGMYQW